MQIKLAALSQSLKKSLSPLYLITGDEPLLVQQAQKEIRQAARLAGFAHRELISIENSKQWESLYSHCGSSDLFSEKKIIDVRNPSGKLDAKAQGLFDHVSQHPNPDNIVMISTAKLTAAQKRTKWFKKLEKTATIITIWPISGHELPRWIKQQCSQAGIHITQDSITLLANLTEGHLLAAQQAITKLKLLFTHEQITPDHVVQAIHDTARFSVFDLSQYALAGNSHKTQRVLQQLQQSGTEPILILWALSKDIRLLQTLLHARDGGHDMQTLLRSEWQSRQQLLKNAARRLELQPITQLLRLACTADKIIKGRERGDIWRTLSQLSLGLSGLPIQIQIQSNLT